MEILIFQFLTLPVLLSTSCFPVPFTRVANVTFSDTLKDIARRTTARNRLSPKKAFKVSATFHLLMEIRVATNIRVFVKNSGIRYNFGIRILHLPFGYSFLMHYMCVQRKLL